MFQWLHRQSQEGYLGVFNWQRKISIFRLHTGKAKDDIWECLIVKEKLAFLGYVQANNAVIKEKGTVE